MWNQTWCYCRPTVSAFQEGGGRRERTIIRKLSGQLAWQRLPAASERACFKEGVCCPLNDAGAPEHANPYTYTHEHAHIETQTETYKKHTYIYAHIYH